ncbi:MAG: OmpA family protein [Verrucomicrobiota bacterium]
MRPIRSYLCALTLGLASLTLAQPAEAQNQGFTVNRYDPTTAGEWSFWVDHPWYSKTRYFAAGITLNYAHDPLVFGRINGSGFEATRSVIEHQLLGHVDIAGSFLDRVTLNLSLPITLLERGNASAGVTPTEGVGMGDPRLGFMIRLYGQPDESAFSISFGSNFYIPLRALTGDTSAITPTSSDSGFRFLPKVVLGDLAHHVRWSFVGAFLYRPTAVIGTTSNPDGSTTGPELQLGALVQYADTQRRFAIGPELMLATVVTEKPFSRDYTSLELLLGAHYNVANQVQLGLAGGLGALRQPGTPDGRVLLRVAYAPIRKAPTAHDRDGDGISDSEDICPDDPAGRYPDPERRGCPLSDRDKDGVFDRDDLCPDVPKGPTPDPERKGCPLGDRDGDGVSDRDDICPDEAQGNNPDPEKRGCPLRDRDKDTVFDRDDLCPDVPQGPVPDPQRKGCPAGDRDKDGVLDPLDACPDTPAGLNPDPERPGCPASDRDHDQVPDRVDACPDKPGAPHPDPKKNGCPSLIEIKNGMLVILKPVFFATNKDEILPQSFPVLQAVADALLATASIKKISIEGHTDNRGKADYNTELSDRRAQSVVRWLSQHSIAADRMSAKGFGPARPVANNGTAKGRAANRRVDFVIVDPPQAVGIPSGPVEAPVIIDHAGKGGGKKRTK